jgi:hypothetical protein
VILYEKFVSAIIGWVEMDLKFAIRSTGSVFNIGFSQLWSVVKKLLKVSTFANQFLLH